MRLSYNVSSPYIRRVSIMAAWLGISDKIENVTCIPYTDQAFREKNPGGLVPSIELEDGSHIHDSLTIGYYFDQQYGDGSLMKAFTTGDIPRLILYSEIEALQQALVKLRQDVMRGADRPVDWYIERYRDTCLLVSASLNQKISALESRDFVTASAIAALGMMEFRSPEIAWRKAAPELSAWLDQQESDATIHASFPKDL